MFQLRMEACEGRDCDLLGFIHLIYSNNLWYMVGTHTYLLMFTMNNQPLFSLRLCLRFVFYATI